MNLIQMFRKFNSSLSFFNEFDSNVPSIEKTLETFDDRFDIWTVFLHHEKKPHELKKKCKYLWISKWNNYAYQHKIAKSLASQILTWKNGHEYLPIRMVLYLLRHTSNSQFILTIFINAKRLNNNTVKVSYWDRIKKYYSLYYSK
jgi:hypothetical protein